MRDVKQVLDFWFAEDTKPRWFKKDSRFDQECRRFEALHERAAAGQLSAWQNAPDSTLALVLCLDQFPRNLYRGTPRAFATDEEARLVADWAVDREYDLKFESADHRMFFYLPFEHSEDLDDQHRSVELIRARCENEELLRYAVAHRDVIARYGRFPHRNAILGRRNTPDEEEYLSKPNAGF